MAIKHLNGAEAREAAEKGELTLLNVTATWCGPCQMFAPILEEISNDIQVIKVDLDENRGFATEMKVQGVPTTFIYKDGKKVDKIVGYVPKEVLEAKIASLK